MESAPGYARSCVDDAMNRGNDPFRKGKCEKYWPLPSSSSECAKNIVPYPFSYWESLNELLRLCWSPVGFLSFTCPDRPAGRMGQRPAQQRGHTSCSGLCGVRWRIGNGAEIKATPPMIPPKKKNTKNWSKEKLMAPCAVTP